MSRIHNEAWKAGVGNPGASTAALTGVWRRPLPGMAGRPVTRFCCRALASVGMGCLRESSGWEHVLPSQDPFILAPNHSTRFEALLLPALLAIHRGGRQVHFLADWNFLMIPLLGSLIRMNDPIIVTRKPAKPRFLNALKPVFTRAEPPFAEARRRLEAGESLGIFPEGTVNTREETLLRGRNGVARLSLETGVPVIPVGIQYSAPTSRRFNLESLTVRMGQPLRPGTDFVGTTAPAAAVRAWHQTTMRAIADLSGKTWQPHNPRNIHAPAHPSNAN